MKHLAQHRYFGRHIWWLVTTAVLLVVVYVAVGRVTMHLLPQWRAPIVHLIQERSSFPLSIGAIRGRMEGLTPVIELHQVRLQSSGSDEALTIDRVSLAPDLLMSLMHRSVWLRELHLSGLQLALEQRDDGSFHLAGLPRREAADNDSLTHFLAVLYQQKRVLLDQVDVRVHLQDSAPFSVHQARLEMLSSGGRHQLAAKLTSDDNQTLDLRLLLKKDAYALADISGSVYLTLSGKDFQQWIKSHWNGPDIDALDGTVVARGSLIKGQLDEAALQVNIDRLILADGGHQWRADSISAKAGARFHQGYQLQVEQLEGHSEAGPWSLGPINLAWQTQEQRPPEWKLSLAQVDIASLAEQMIGWPLPMPDTLQHWQQQLAAMTPSGEIEALYAEGVGKDLAYVDGHVAGVASHAVGKLPGIKGINGWFAGSPESGVAALHVTDGQLDIPLVYHHPLAFDADGQLQWRWQKGHLQLQTGLWQGGTPDGRGRILAAVDVAPEQPPKLHLLADIHSDHGDKTAFYIPDEKLPDALGHWLKTAIQGGRLSLGRFLYEGPVHIDPERQQDRTLQMRFDANDATLEFLPGWPAITAGVGRVFVDGHRAWANGVSGQIAHSEVTDAGFKTWVDSDGLPFLEVKGEVNGPAKDVSMILSDTPLTEHLPAELADWTLTSGQVSGQLQMRFLLRKGSKVPPQVSVQARGKDVALENSARRLQFTHANGEVSFDLQQGINIPAMTAQWLEQPITATVATQKDKVTIKAQMHMPVRPLADWLRADWMASLSGAAQAEAEIVLPWRKKAPVTLQVTSDLRGVVVDLPAPLAQSAKVAAPLKLTLVDGREATFTVQGEPAWQGKLRLVDGGLSTGALLIGRGQLPALPRHGLNIAVGLAQLDVQPWLTWVEDELADNVTSDKQTASLLQQLDITSDVMQLFALRLDDATLALQPDKITGGWHFALRSQQLRGDMVLPKNYKLRGNTPLDLHVQSLTLPEAQQKNKVLEKSDWSPSMLPNANVTLEHVRLGTDDYGRWQGHLRPVADGIRVEALQGAWRGATFAGELWWVESNDSQQTRFTGSVETDDIGHLQKQWGFPAALESSEPVTATVDAYWPGSPLDLDYLSLSGPVTVRVGRCQLPEMNRNNPLLRLIGAFNVSSIKRRLKLDFSDLYKKGLSCDSIKAALEFQHNIVDVKSLKLKSPSADIQLTGTVNLKTKALNNEATVVLPLSSNLYVGCVAGPIACAGIFAFDRLLGERLEKAAALDYHVSGTWSDPVVKEK